MLAAPFRSLLAARAALLGYAETVEVVAPDELRAEMAAAAERVVALYTAGLDRSSLPDPGPPH